MTPLGLRVPPAAKPYTASPDDRREPPHPSEQRDNEPYDGDWAAERYRLEFADYYTPEPYA